MVINYAELLLPCRHREGAPKAKRERAVIMTDFFRPMTDDVDSLRYDRFTPLPKFVRGFCES